MSKKTLSIVFKDALKMQNWFPYVAGNVIFLYVILGFYPIDGIDSSFKLIFFIASTVVIILTQVIISLIAEHSDTRIFPLALSGLGAIVWVVFCIQFPMSSDSIVFGSCLFFASFWIFLNSYAKTNRLVESVRKFLVMFFSSGTLNVVVFLVAAVSLSIYLVDGNFIKGSSIFWIVLDCFLLIFLAPKAFRKIKQLFNLKKE